jgi:hypothetical protein
MEITGLFGLDSVYTSDPLPNVEAAYTIMAS